MNGDSHALTGQASRMRLRVVQASFGDCLILEYDLDGLKHHILIDGGPEEIYREHLKPQLQEISRQNGRLDLMVLSHVDEDHVAGLVDLMSDLAQEPYIPIDRLWFNSFRTAVGGDDFMMAAFASTAAEGRPHSSLYQPAFSIAQGEDLWKAAMIFKIPINSGFTEELVHLGTAPRPVEMEGIRLWVLGPSQKNMERYRREWLKWYEKNKHKPLGTAALREARKVDTSFSNLSSILLLAEAGGRRILLTGDGRGEDVLMGLEKTGFLHGSKPFHVNVFKVPHHGSERNASQELFERVPADIYVISAARHREDGNPDYRTLEWIVNAARGQHRKIQIWVTNANGSTRELLRKLPPVHNDYSLLTFKRSQNAIIV